MLLVKNPGHSENLIEQSLVTYGGVNLSDDINLTAGMKWIQTSLRDTEMFL